MIAWYSTYDPLGLAVEDEGFRRSRRGRGPRTGRDDAAAHPGRRRSRGRRGGPRGRPVGRAAHRLTDERGATRPVSRGRSSRWARRPTSTPTKPPAARWKRPSRTGWSSGGWGARTRGRRGRGYRRVRRPAPGGPGTDRRRPGRPRGIGRTGRRSRGRGSPRRARRPYYGRGPGAVRDADDDPGPRGYRVRSRARPRPGAQPLFLGDPFFGERARAVPADLGFEFTPDRPHHPFPDALSLTDPPAFSTTTLPHNT